MTNCVAAPSIALTPTSLTGAGGVPWYNRYSMLASTAPVQLASAHPKTS